VSVAARVRLLNPARDACLLRAMNAHSIVTKQRVKILGALKDAHNLDAVRLRTVENEVVPKPLNAQRPKAGKLGKSECPWPAHAGHLG